MTHSYSTVQCFVYLIRVTHLVAYHFERLCHTVETVVPIQYPGVLGWWKINCHPLSKKSRNKTYRNNTRQGIRSMDIHNKENTKIQHYDNNDNTKQDRKMLQNI